MKRVVAITAAIVALAAAAPAWAAKTFVLNGVQLQGGGTLTGSFTTNDAMSSLLGIDITASAGSFGPGVFSQFTYNNASLADWVSLPSQGFRISAAGGSKQLRLDFFPLTATGANILGSSYEYQSTGGGRAVIGGKVVQSVQSAVPEPATWAMMIVGFGLAGTALRTRARKPAYAVA